MPGALGDPANIGASLGGCRDGVAAAMVVVNDQVDERGDLGIG